MEVTFAAAYVKLPSDVQDYFSRVGLGPEKAVRWSNIFDTESDAYDFAADAFGEIPEDCMDFVDFLDAVIILASRAEGPASAATARSMAQNAVIRNGAFIAVRNAAAKRRLETLDRVTELLVTAPAVQVPWRTRRQRDLAKIDGTLEDAKHQRAQVEENERLKWALRWAEFLLATGRGSSIDLALKSEDPVTTLARTTGRRRAGTLRGRLLDCRKMSKWCQRSLKSLWFSSGIDFLTYLEQVAADVGDAALIGKVDTDANAALSERFGISSIPTLLFFRDGQEVHRTVGVVPAAELSARLSGLATETD